MLASGASAASLTPSWLAWSADKAVLSAKAFYRAEQLGIVFIAQVGYQHHQGPALLSRQQLIGGGKGLGDLGFGSEVKDALQRRADFLAEQGLAERRGQRVILTRTLRGTLRTRELAQAAKDIAVETGLEHRPVADGQRVAGIYRRSVMLVKSVLLTISLLASALAPVASLTATPAAGLPL